MSDATLSGDQAPDEPSQPLRLHVGLGGVSFRDLIDVERDFNHLLAELAQGMTGLDGAVRWVVADVDRASAVFVIEPERTSREVPAQVVRDISHAVVTGLAELGTARTRPPFFSDRALQLAARIATSARRRGIPYVRVLNGNVGADFSPELAKNVSALLLEDEFTEWGTVEGRLQAWTVAKRRMFAVWDELTGDRIECDFGHRIPSNEIGSKSEQRVMVSGIIHYDQQGGIRRVVAEEIEALPDASELPSAADVFGILAE